MNNSTFPCKNCTNRVVGCHSHCDAYKKAKTNYDKTREETKRFSDINDFIFKSIAKKSKNRKRIYSQRNFINE